VRRVIPTGSLRLQNILRSCRSVWKRGSSHLLCSHSRRGGRA
jgi:hypothetical protein